MHSPRGLAIQRFAGSGPCRINEWRAVLHDVDVLVVPSMWIENAPFIIREAFAAGVPVIASDLGGMAEMVRDGVDGLLFPPGDARSLAACLRRLSTRTACWIALAPGSCPRCRSRPRPPAFVRCMALAQGRPRRILVGVASGVHASVAAVVLNYNTPDQTWLAVRSLQTSFTPPDRIFVVDNGSTTAPSMCGRPSPAWV